MGAEAAFTSEDTNPSSPAPAVFSDEATRSATPPSSPPGFPWEQQDGVTIDGKTEHSPPAKNAFSMLGKRKVLEDISENARPKKRVAFSSASKQTRSLSQMQISLGQEVQKKCKTCGMEYVPSSAEDRKLHDKYHKQNTEGCDVGKDFVERTELLSVFAGAKDGDKICAIDCRDPHHRKRRGQTALEIVQRELGAVEIPKQHIWDEEHSESSSPFDSSYRAFLYIKSTKCIGFLLVQKTKDAHRVIEPAIPSKQSEQKDAGPCESAKGALGILQAKKEATEEQLRQPLELSKQLHPARLGISRIWTSLTHRKQNIATSLLDAAFEDFNRRARGSKALIEQTQEKQTQDTPSFERLPKEFREGCAKLTPMFAELDDKDAVAFSQPTEAGIRLARSWFGKVYGWKVYMD